MKNLLVVHENAPRRKWPLGRVANVYTDSEGFVRSVEVQVYDSEKERLKDLHRPIDKLVLVLEN